VTQFVTREKRIRSDRFRYTRKENSLEKTAGLKSILPNRFHQTIAHVNERDRKFRFGRDGQAKAAIGII
jgi:hypothetical protein